MTNTLKVACAQLTSTTDIAKNIEISSELIREAHGQGAQLIGLPEVVNLVQRSRRESAEVVKTEDEETSLKAYRELAAELGVWLHTGSLVIKLMDDERNVNRSFLIDDKGAIAATYDKIHMFDVDLENGVSFRESKAFKPGDRAVVAETPWCGLGMTVCYDVRFAHLYRALAKAGASVLMVPAAWICTRPSPVTHRRATSGSTRTSTWIWPTSTQLSRRIRSAGRKRMKPVRARSLGAARACCRPRLVRP